MPSLEHNGLWNQETRENVHNREKRRAESSKTGWEIHNEECPIQEIGRFEIFVRLSAIFETSLKLIEFPMKRTRLDLEFLL